ncbi:MAG TPA: four helix bundle protein [Cytophagaceae bacterium]|jgi:four helix bundle protein|nr:four helix bundle protein [Cytophagaceae bacterium]
MINYKVVDKTFQFSIKVMELYVLLLKNGEFELAEKILKNSLVIRENIEESFAAITLQDRVGKLSEALHNAAQVRFWLKLIQMKNMVHSCCDETVEGINEIINILNYLGIRSNDYKLNLQYQLN